MSIRCLRPSIYILPFVFAFLVGCDTNNPATDDEITGIRMLPDSASIEAGDQFQFSIVAVTESGEELEEHDLDVRWWSTDTDVFTVSDNGVAVANEAGSAWCMAEDENLSKNQSAMRFVGRDSAFVTVLF